MFVRTIVLLFFFSVCCNLFGQANDLQVNMWGLRMAYLYEPVAYTVKITCKKSKEKVKVKLSTPSQMKFVSADPKADVSKDGVILWELVGIESAAEIKLTLKGLEVGLMRCEVEATCQDEKAVASFGTRIIGVPALHVGCYDTEDPIAIGGESVYVVECRNEGTSPVTSVKMRYTHPGQVEFVDAQAKVSFRYENGKVAFAPVAILEPGKRLSYKVKVKGLKSGVAKSDFCFEYDQFAHPIHLQETTCVGGLQPALHSSCYDTEDPVKAGGQTVYVIELRNEGEVPCTGLALCDIIPDEAEFVEASGPTAYKHEKGKVSFAPVALGPGKKLVYKVKVSMLEAGSAKNIATWSCDQFSQEIIEEEGTSVYR